MKELIVSEKVNEVACFKIAGFKQYKILIFLPGLEAYKVNYIFYLKNFKNYY